MVHILYPPQIQDLKSDHLWPARFDENDVTKPSDGVTKKSFTEYRSTKPVVSDDSEDSDDSLEENVNQRNRPVVYLSETDSESD